MKDHILGLASPSSTDPRDRTIFETLQSERVDFDREPTRHLLGRNRDYAVQLVNPPSTVYVSASEATDLRDLQSRNYSLSANPGMGGLQGRVASVATSPTPITNTDLF